MYESCNNVILSEVISYTVRFIRRSAFT